MNKNCSTKELLKIEETNKKRIERLRKQFHKKNSKIEKYEPSHFQREIFNYIENEQGNLVIEACSGSGKTTTLLKAMLMLPQDKSMLYAAFNNAIVKEIADKISLKNLTIRTIHGLGYLYIKDYIHENVMLQIDEYKYSKYISNHINELRDSSIKLRKNDFSKYIYTIKQLTNLSRMYLCDSVKEVKEVADKYGYFIVADEIEIVLKVLDWGKSYFKEFDYTDMIWLPHVLDMNNNRLRFDYIFVDEMQDLNKAQMSLIMRCCKISTRYFFVGDRNQSIYSFMGSDSDIVEEIKNLPNTKTLPLSMSYRCPKEVVRIAKEMVPEICSPKYQKNGEVKYDCTLDDLTEGDVVLCRNNAPLAKLYTILMKNGKKSHILGKEIGEELMNLIDLKGKFFISADLSEDGLVPILYNDLFYNKRMLMNSSGLSEEEIYNHPTITSKLDIINLIIAISEGTNDTKKLYNRIKKIFKEKRKKGITLTTCHKSKGKEFERVFILMDDLLTNPKGDKKDWEKEQSKNLRYVAYTRAKDMLGFLNNDVLEDAESVRKKSVKYYNEIEQRIYELYSNNAYYYPQENGVKEEDIYDISSKIENIHKKPKLVQIKEAREEEKQTKLLNRRNKRLAKKNSSEK